MSAALAQRRPARRIRRAFVTGAARGVASAIEQTFSGKIGAVNIAAANAAHEIVMAQERAAAV